MKRAPKIKRVSGRATPLEQRRVYGQAHPIVRVDGFASPADIAPVVRTHYGLGSMVWIGAVEDAFAQGLEVRLSLVAEGEPLVSIGRPARPGWTNTELEDEAA